ncbi:MAG: LEA type 2 family protein [Brumimicrobium sp.]|nr:LEA type 2 family protein [Brumimicrobium sp.]
MRHLIKPVGILFFLSIILTSCIEQPEYKGMSNLKIDHINQEEVVFNIDIEAYNPNGFKINIKKSVFDIYLNDDYVGKIHVTQKYKMKKKSATIAAVPIQLELGKGVLFKLLSMTLGKPLNARIVGKLKASGAGFPISRKIDKTKEINLEELGINLRDLL